MIRTYLPGDEVGINELYKLVFEKERSIEEWKWKFEIFSSPEPIIIVAELDGKIVGHAACLKIPGFYQGLQVILGERVDIMVHPKYQGQRIYQGIVNRMLVECHKQKIDVLYGFPAEKAKAIFLNVASGEDLGNIPRFLAVQRPGTLIGAKLPALEGLLKVLDRPYGLFLRKKTPYRLQKYDSTFSKTIDDLYSRYASSYPAHAIRDSAYIHKRFLSHPTRDYQVYLITEDDKAIGYTVCLTDNKDNGLTTATILDLWAEPDNAVLKDVLIAIRNDLDAALINCWAVTASQRFSALKAAGFRHINSPMPFVIKVFNNELNVSHISDWHLSQSDVDSY